jgi:hypothetical protein
MLDFAGSIAIAALTVFVVGALLIFIDISRTAKLALAALLGLWIGVAAAAAATGVMATSSRSPSSGRSSWLPCW